MSNEVVLDMDTEDGAADTAPLPSRKGIGFYAVVALLILGVVGVAFYYYTGRFVDVMGNTIGVAVGSVNAEKPAQRVVATVNSTDIYESDILREIQSGAVGSPNDVLQAYINVVLIANSLEGNSDAKAAVQYAVRKALTEHYMKTSHEDVSKSVSDSDVADFYKRNVVASEYDRYKISYYLSQDQADATSTAEKFSRGESLDKLKPMTMGGNNYLLSRDIPYGMARVIAGMKNGEVTPTPIVIRDGFIVVRRDDHQTGAKPSLESVKAQIREVLIRKKLSDQLAELRKSADIRIRN